MLKSVKIDHVILKTEYVSSFKDTSINSLDAVPIGNEKAVKNLFPDGTSDMFLNSMKLGKDHPAQPDEYTTFIMTEEWAESFSDAVNLEVMQSMV